MVLANDPPVDVALVNLPCDDDAAVGIGSCQKKTDWASGLCLRVLNHSDAFPRDASKICPNIFVNMLLSLRI